jgi:hypothetical protein
MKKIVTFFVIVFICSATNIQVFSQKIRNTSVKKLPVVKSETPTANVALKSAEAFSDGKGVFLRWQAEHETQNLGFFVYRAGRKGPELVTPSIIGGASLKSSETVTRGEKYSFFDPDGNLSNSYYIESVGLNGKRQTFGPFSGTPVNDLAAVAGAQELTRTRFDKIKPSIDQSLVNLPKDLQEEVEANSLPPDIIKQRWVAAQPGVKISVKQEGVYRVSRTELQNAGFDVNAAGNLWQLYMDGKEQSIVVGPGDSYIEFYGKGIDTPESDTKVYYLLVGPENGRRIESTVIRPLSGSVVSNNYLQTFVQKERKIYISSDILNGEEENFFGNVPIIGANSPTPGTVNYNFGLTGIDYNAPTAVLHLGIQGITTTPHQIIAKINGYELPAINGSGKHLMTGSFEIPTNVLIESAIGNNVLAIQTFGGAGDINLVESVRVSYNREYKAIQNKLSFYTGNYRATSVSGFSTPDIRVFDLTYPDSPTVLTNLVIFNNNGNYSVSLPPNRGRALFATQDTALLAPSSIVQNTPSTLSTAAHNGDLVIISYKDWMTEANSWANYRRTQGLTVEVVNIEDIYDEFSYGSVNTTGITQFFMYAKDNWQTGPNYALLLGDTSYDFRNYENRAFQNFVPTKLVDTIYEETGSDEALCDFNNDGLAEIAVGRIPARNAATVTQLLGKNMSFESTLATAFNRGALFASDLPNGYDFEGLSQRLAVQLPPGIPKTFINRAQADAKNLLLAEMNAGRYIVNYSGHGSVGIWDGNFFTIADANLLANQPNYTMFFMLTCLNGYFIRTDADSLGETVLKAPNGAGVIAWASTGKTTPDVQEVLATRFYSQFTLGNMTRIGDLIKDAKTNLVGGRDVRLSWALLGDPTMRTRP